MTADERVALIRHKSEWAAKHIADLQSRISTFINTKPYEVGCKTDPESRKPIYYIVRVEDTPVTISLVIGDALQCLRSTLDYLVYELALVNGVAEADTYSLDFPIGRNLDAFRSQLGKLKRYETKDGRVVKPIRQDALHALEAVEPYPGGKGAVLWTLHNLNNVDKHRTVLTAGAHVSVDLFHGLTKRMASMMSDRVAGMKPIQGFFREAHSSVVLKAGHELLIGMADEECDKDQQFRFDVAFAESTVVQGQAVIPTLHEMTNLINGIVTTFHAAGLLS